MAVLAEDTRRTRQLLDHYGIRTPMIAYHEHNEARGVPRILERLAGGDDLALVSDAGTPLLSDPGARLVAAAVERGLPVVPIPGASALLASLVASGLTDERFTFYGFLPRQGRTRQAALREVVESPHVAVIYEAPSRTGATLDALREVGAGDRMAVVARELTKKFEEFRRGTVTELSAYYQNAAPRGEVVILIGAGAETRPDEAALSAAARRLRAEGLSPRDVARRLNEDFSAPRNLAYRLAQEAGE
ncbi:16S rRNA (cytidine(1402)-2'-O)-methyltransferase [soil metagenome]